MKAHELIDLYNAGLISMVELERGIAMLNMGSDTHTYSTAYNRTTNKMELV